MSYKPSRTISILLSPVFGVIVPYIIGIALNSIVVLTLPGMLHGRPFVVNVQRPNAIFVVGELSGLRIHTLSALLKSISMCAYEPVSI